MKTELVDRGCFVRFFDAFNLAKDLIKKYEGMSNRVYQDAVGFATVGYGYKLRRHDDIRYIDDETAEYLLDGVIINYMKYVIDHTRVNLSEGQLAALTSFVYNVGPRAFQRSTLLKKLNDHDYQGAADELLKWVYAGGKKLAGLEIRRNEERRIFLGKNEEGEDGD